MPEVGTTEEVATAHKHEFDVRDSDVDKPYQDIDVLECTHDGCTETIPKDELHGARAGTATASRPNEWDSGRGSWE